MASLPDYNNCLLQVVFSGKRDFKKFPLKQLCVEKIEMEENTKKILKFEFQLVGLLICWSTSLVHSEVSQQALGGWHKIWYGHPWFPEDES